MFCRQRFSGNRCVSASAELFWLFCCFTLASRTFSTFFFLFLILSLSLLLLCMPEGEGGKGAVWVLCVTGFTTLRNIDSFPEGAPCVCVGNGFVLNGNVPLAGVEKQGQRER